MDWLHFVGNQFYSIKEFEKEAHTFGVSRRISVNMLKQMEYGDTIWLFQGGKDGSVLFGFFVIDKILGKLPDELKMDPRFLKGILSISDGEPIHVVRGCGSFTMGGGITLNLSLSELAALIEEYGCENLMVGGEFVPCDRQKTEIPHQQGFRKFNVPKFEQAVQEKKTSGAKVKGQYYVIEDYPSDRPRLPKNVVLIEDYKKGGIKIGKGKNSLHKKSAGGTEKELQESVRPGASDLAGGDYDLFGSLHSPEHPES